MTIKKNYRGLYLSGRIKEFCPIKVLLKLLDLPGLD
jgi:hypothetical protein